METKSAKRRLCGSKDAINRAVCAIRIRVHDMTSRGIDATNAPGRGTVPTGPMGIIWAMVGIKGIAVASRTSAATYISARTVSVPLGHFGQRASMTAHRLVAAWPSLGQIRTVALAPARLQYAAAHMLQLERLSIIQRTDEAVDSAVVQMMMRTIAPRLHTLEVLPQSSHKGLAEWIPSECPFERLDDLRHNHVMALDVPWLCQQPWAAGLTSISMRVDICAVDEAKSLSALAGACPKLTTLCLTRGNLRVVVPQSVAVEMARAVPATVTNLLLATRHQGDKNVPLSCLDHVKHLTSINVPHLVTNTSAIALMASHPRLLNVQLVPFYAAKDYLPSLRNLLPLVETFSLAGISGLSPRLVGEFLDAHPRLVRRAVWRSCSSRMSIDEPSKWDNECLEACRVVGATVKLSPEQLHRFWTHAHATAALSYVFAVDRIELKTVNSRLRFLSVMSPTAYDDDFMNGVLGSFPNLRSLSLVSALSDYAITLSATTVRRLVGINSVKLISDMAFVLRDGDLDALAHMVAESPRCHFRCKISGRDRNRTWTTGAVSANVLASGMLVLKKVESQ